MLAQVYYYRWKSTRTSASAEEQTPLLNGDSRAQEETPVRVIVLRYTGAIIFVFATGVVAWAISGGEVREEVHKERTELPTRIQWIVQILGWSSALLYVRPRLPTSSGHTFLIPRIS